MLQQWKRILTNWINCYFNNTSKDEQNLNIESLLNIISHLRENLNLDESKSSILEAHTVEEFLREKYPEFKFHNGTVEATNEEEICLSASLLLYFVCVNSKNLDIKNAMCSKLSPDNQETILKYSKCLMECPVITVMEVQAAITESCGQDIAAMELPHQCMIAETPPALRSLHSEVRRLNAALDAERFDRNYLQEELSRTHVKLEHLLKEKEQHKLDILNLKAKISLCCGEEAIAKNAEAAADKTSKITRQQQQMEQRLEEMQTQLDDVAYERDAFKAKIDELKHERDKWLTESHQEHARVSELTDELDNERRNVQSLKDLVAELRQHNKLNGLDSSSLECDDPDASIHSLPHNFSLCSEPCANVVEVQLGEERAKIVVLKEQIQILQDQINELNQKSETDKTTLENTVAQRENDIFILKHRINEEIEEKNNLQSECDYKTTKLNNEINELEQKLKDNNEYSRSIIEKKMVEIQTIQEEKLSLLRSLNSETTKLENVIKDLKCELSFEKQTRLNMKEGYENHIMKLNEKVLNRNNELVELQDSIFEKGEKIETLQIELRKEKEALNELKTKYQNLDERKNSIENDLRHKYEEVQNLNLKIQHNNTIIEDLNMEIQLLKTSLSSLNENYKTLQGVKEQLLDEIRNREIRIEQTLKDINDMNEVFNKEKDKLCHDMDERNATVNSLQVQLQSEIQFKVGLQNELTQLQIAKTAMSEENEKINSELAKLKIEIEDKDRTINALDLCIQEEKNCNVEANENILKLAADIAAKENYIQTLNEKLESTSKCLQEEKQKNYNYTEVARNKLLTEIAERETLQLQLNSLFTEKSHMEKDLSSKCEEILMLQDECGQLTRKVDENETFIKAVEEKLRLERQSKSKLSDQKEIEIKELKNDIVVLQSIKEELKQNLIKEIEAKTQVIYSLENDIKQLNLTIEENKSNHGIVIKEKETIINILEQQVRDNINKFEYLRQHNEELRTSWDNYKTETKAALKEKEDKIAQLNEMALTFEQKINEVEQEKGELCKQIVQIGVKFETLESEEKAIRDTLESEKETLIEENKGHYCEKENLLADNAMLMQELSDEKSIKIIVENEKKLLISEKEKLFEEKALIAEELAEQKSAKKITEEEKNILLSEQIVIKQQLNKEIETTTNLLRENDCLTQHLIEEKLAKEISEKEKELLIAEKELLEERIIENENVKSEEIHTLNCEIHNLQLDLTKLKEAVIILNQENKMLNEECIKEKSLKQNLLEEKESLLSVNGILKNDLLYLNSAHDKLKADGESLEVTLRSEISTMEIDKNNIAAKLELEIMNREEKNKSLFEECEKLRQLFQENKDDHEARIQEKECLLLDMKNAQNILKVEKESLNKALSTEKSIHEQIQSEKNALAFKLEVELIKNEEEKKILLDEIEKLKTALNEEKSVQDSIIKNKDLIVAENDALVISLSNEKCARDEIETEKKDLILKLEHLTEKVDQYEIVCDEYSCNVGIKEQEAKQFKTALKQLEADYQYLQETFTKTSTTLSESLIKLLHKFKTENVSTDVLGKLINVKNFNDLPLSEACNLIFNLADALVSEVSLLKKLEISLKSENVALSEMQESLKQKDLQVIDLQTEIRRLEQVGYENNIEATKQSETYATSMNLKIKDIQTLQQENKTLHHDLNDVKVQLEVKVLSLKEKLIENEIVTDKLKQSYECQIDNLNVMITKLTNYLKEKTVELEVLTKNNDLLRQTLEDNCNDLQETNTKISRTLSEGLNKLVHKFETENLSTDVLKNLINDKNFNDLPLSEACELTFNIADVLASEVSHLKKLEITLKSENVALSEMQEALKQKEIEVFDLKTVIKRLEQIVYENDIEATKQSETYAMSMNSKAKDFETLQQENKTLHHDLNDVKVQLEVKVHSMKEKLIESEIVADKLKTSSGYQIENLNVMITKLTNHMKEKTVELEALRKDKDLLQQTVGDSCKVIKTLEDDVKAEKQTVDKLMSEFEAERQVLKNMVIVTEAVMEDQQLSLNNAITEHLLAKECLKVENNELKTLLQELELKCRGQEMVYSSLFSLLRIERKVKEDLEKESEDVRNYLDEIISYIIKERNTNISVISALEFQEKVLSEADYEKIRSDLEATQKDNNELKISLHGLQSELQKVLQEKTQVENDLQINANQLTALLEEKCLVEKTLQEKIENLTVVQLEIKELKFIANEIFKEKNILELEKKESIAKIEEFKVKIDSIDLEDKMELAAIKKENQHLQSTVEENKSVILNLEQLIKHELEENHKLRDLIEHEKLVTANKSYQLQDYHTKIEKELEQRLNEIVTLRKEIDTLQDKVEICEQDSKAKDGLMSKLSKEKDAIISTISKELVEEKALRDTYEKESQALKSLVTELKNSMEIRALKKENEQLIRAIGQQETVTALRQEKAVEKYTCEPELRDLHQVDNSSSDNTHSSVESLKTITDLEKIIYNKNRSITTLQTDITYLKTIMAESETKLLDVNKELEVSKDTCEQLSVQLKKIVYQKNEEIAELKKQVAKLSATENRATEIIKVSAKYQAMILKRIAEIKSNTVLKELTNFGNSNNCDIELRRGLNAGTVTMEDLENFLETTDRHLKRCSEKQITLQKERDRLTEVNRINDSEIISVKMFLNELSVSFQTFSSIKDMYGHKLSRVISVQRTVRREILNLDGRITVAGMCKLERGYGAAMQDMSECTLNLQRWVERCISRTVSVEKIKQAFTSDSERSSLASPSFQNTGLEIQLQELERSFQKLLEEVARAAKGEGAKESQASTVMEVRAEYEDKLNRMKSKMKDLFNEQMAVLKNKQREEIGLLDRELQKTRERMEESKRAYEKHIRELTKELWSVGEKYLVKNDEAEWLRKKQRSGSLMSLQHVHSSGLVSSKEPPSRPSDAQSLRSLRVTDCNSKIKREGRGVHMSDEEGEVFDNRWLQELSSPRRAPPPGLRLSELKWRNSLCPPHLKSSYPAETQFAPALDEEEIKAGPAGASAARAQRKEVGITAYKKPGPPTPSKQAGRLSATDSDLREAARADSSPAERRSGTPARFRAFMRFSNKSDANQGTPRTRRLSSIFRKK